MPCCGNKREELKKYYSNNSTDSSVSESPGKLVLQDYVNFEYTGEKSLSVTGSLTRKHYFFSEKGKVLTVYGKDVPGMMGVPNVRKVKS
jgi:hypothetical protein